LKKIKTLNYHNQRHRKIPIVICSSSDWRWTRQEGPWLYPPGLGSGDRTGADHLMSKLTLWTRLDGLVGWILVVKKKHVGIKTLNLIDTWNGITKLLNLIERETKNRDHRNSRRRTSQSKYQQIKKRRTYNLERKSIANKKTSIGGERCRGYGNEDHGRLWRAWTMMNDFSDMKRKVKLLLIFF
jgi:hypothetical protein